MTIIQPLNDVDCLSQLHDAARRQAAQPKAQEMARTLRTTAALAAWIRRLPQRDDLGDPADGPRLPCDVSQRARFSPGNPNCFERLLSYLTVAEILDPGTERTSASILVSGGWHTFPVEIRDGLPVVVVLDPLGPPRNAALATAYDVCDVAVTRPDVLAPWFAEMARNVCMDVHAGRSFDRAIGSLRNAVLTGEPLAHEADIEQVLSLAGVDAWLWGESGADAVARVEGSIRNLSLNLQSGRVERFLRKLADAGEQLGREIGPKALRAALVAEFGPVAVIALDGMNVAIQGGDGAEAGRVRPSGGQEARAGEPGDAQGDDGDPGTDERRTWRAQHAQRAQRAERTNIENMRRMTFAFRTSQG